MIGSKPLPSVPHFAECWPGALAPVQALQLFRSNPLAFGFLSHSRFCLDIGAGGGMIVVEVPMECCGPSLPHRGLNPFGLLTRRGSVGEVRSTQGRNFRGPGLCGSHREGDLAADRNVRAPSAWVKIVARWSNSRRLLIEWKSALRGSGALGQRGPTCS